MSNVTKYCIVCKIHFSWLSGLEEYKAIYVRLCLSSYFRPEHHSKVQLIVQQDLPYECVCIKRTTFFGLLLWNEILPGFAICARSCFPQKADTNFWVRLTFDTTQWYLWLYSCTTDIYIYISAWYISGIFVFGMMFVIWPIKGNDSTTIFNYEDFLNDFGKGFCKTNEKKS